MGVLGLFYVLANMGEGYIFSSFYFFIFVLNFVKKKGNLDPILNFIKEGGPHGRPLYCIKKI